MAEKNPSFFESLRNSLFPSGYKKLRQHEPWHALVYLILLILFGLVIKMLFLLPLAFDATSSLQNVSSKFSKASFEGIIETNEPVLIPIKNPLLQIDTSKDAVRKGSVFITQKSISFGDKENPTIIQFPDLSQSANNKQLYTGLFILVIFLAPSIIILFFLGGLIKALILSLFMGMAGFLILKARGGPASIANALAIALYAQTLMVIIESIAVPLRLGEYLFPFFSFLGITFYAISISLSLCMFLIWLVISGSEKYAFG